MFRNSMLLAPARCPLCSLLLGGLLFLFSQQGMLSFQEPPKDWLAEGKRHILERHFSEAVAAFNRFKQISPKDPRPYFFAGIALAEAGRLSAAAAELSEAVRLDPNQPEYVLSHANVLTRLGQKGLAVKALAGLEKEENAKRLSTAGLWQLVEVYFRLEKTEGGFKTLELLSSRDAKDPRIDLYRGRFYKLIGNLDLAQVSFQRSIDLSGNNAPAYYELGKLFEQRGELAASKMALLDALRLDEPNPQYLHALGSVCLTLNEIDEAIAYLEKAEPSGPTLPQIYYTLGQAYQRKGDQAKGAKYLNLKKVHEINLAQRQKEIREHEALTLITLGEERLEQGNAAEARAFFEQVFQLNSNNWHANEYLAQIFLASKEWELAFAHLSKLIEVDPNAFEGNSLMAEYWYGRQDYRQAGIYAERAKSVQPGDAELCNLLGNIYLKLGLPEKALEEYTAAVRLSPDRSDFQSNLQSLSKQNTRSK